MKVYQISYRKDEWVYVNVGFTDDVNVDDLEHETFVSSIVTDQKLTQYETWTDSLISGYSLRVEEQGEGTPDAVIDADGSVFSHSEFLSKSNNLKV